MYTPNTAEEQKYIEKYTYKECYEIFSQKVYTIGYCEETHEKFVILGGGGGGDRQRRKRRK